MFHNHLPFEQMSFRTSVTDEHFQNEEEKSNAEEIHELLVIFLKND